MFKAKKCPHEEGESSQEKPSAFVEEGDLHITYDIVPAYSSTLRQYRMKNALSLKYNKEFETHWHDFLKNTPTLPLRLKRAMSRDEQM